MCGISAIVRFGGDASRDGADLAAMHRLVIHRGPDAEGGFLVDPEMRGRRIERVDAGLAGHGALRLMLGVRRLRVSDLSAEADQPLVSADGRVCAVLNGAIYNYRELAAELKAAGHVLRTASDTEVVLEAYRRWGSACFGKLEGMWAIVIADLERGRVIGSRDRLGIKPLYHAVDGERLLLCSEPAPLASVQQGGARPEPARFFEFLSGYPPQSSALSFFRGVNPVPAGTWFEIDLRADRAQPLRFEKYWDLSDHVRDGREPAMPFEDAATRYRELLTAAVTKQSLADARVGSLLSGGLDTSTIVSLWAEIAGKRGSPSPETYSITWDDPEMSEQQYQQAVAAKSGARSHSLRLTPGEVWDAVDPVIRALGQPLLGQELIAQNFAYRMARERGSVVVLDGNGSDEVQAGLPPYEAEMVYERLADFQLWDVAQEVHAIAKSYGRSHLLAFRQNVIGPVRRRIAERRGLPSYPWLDAAGCDTADPPWAAASARDESRDPSHLNRILYRETKHTNVPAVLMYSDRNSMSHSVEVRYPYLDHRLVEFCFSLPASYKVGFGRRKRLLWETSKDYLPPLVMERKDKKYFVLLTNWMPLRSRAQAIRDAAHNESFTRVPWIDVARMRRFVEDFLAGRHDNAYAVWRIYTASRWMALHGL